MKHLLIVYLLLLMPLASYGMYGTEQTTEKPNQQHQPIYQINFTDAHASCPLKESQEFITIRIPKDDEPLLKQVIENKKQKNEFDIQQKRKQENEKKKLILKQKLDNKQQELFFETMAIIVNDWQYSGRNTNYTIDEIKANFGNWINVDANYRTSLAWPTYEYYHTLKEFFTIKLKKKVGQRDIEQFKKEEIDSIVQQLAHEIYAVKNINIQSALARAQQEMLIHHDKSCDACLFGYLPCITYNIFGWPLDLVLCCIK